MRLGFSRGGNRDACCAGGSYGNCIFCGNLCCAGSIGGTGYCGGERADGQQGIEFSLSRHHASLYWLSYVEVVRLRGAANEGEKQYQHFHAQEFFTK